MVGAVGVAVAAEVADVVGADSSAFLFIPARIGPDA